MSQATLAVVAASPTASPTQALRDLIDAVSWGGASVDELHRALMELELRLRVPLTAATAPSEELDVAA
jgi:hypothetical protein